MSKYGTCCYFHKLIACRKILCVYQNSPHSKLYLTQMNLAEIILVSRPSPYLFAQENWRRPGTITTSQTGNGGLGFVLMATCPCSMHPVQQGIKQWHKWNHYACMSTERNGKSSWLKASASKQVSALGPLSSRRLIARTYVDNWYIPTLSSSLAICFCP